MMSYFKVGEKHEAKVEMRGENYITLTPEVYYRLKSWVDHCTGEVSGFGIVQRHEHTSGTGNATKKWVEFRVSEVVLPAKQKNSGASTDIDAGVVAEVMHELIQAGRNTEDMRLHWHSHVNMGVFHSGTDNENYDDLDNSNWLVSLVLNKAGDVLGRVDYYKPMRIAMIGVPVYVENTVSEDVVADTKAKADALDEEAKKSSTMIGFPRNNNGGYGYATDGWEYEGGKWVYKGTTGSQWDGYEGYVGNAPALDKKETRKLEMIKNKIRSKLRLKKDVTDKFEKCFNSSSELCARCESSRKCEEYLFSLQSEAGDLVELGGGGDIPTDEPTNVPSPVVSEPTTTIKKEDPVNVMDADTVDFYRGRESNGFN